MSRAAADPDEARDGARGGAEPTSVGEPGATADPKPGGGADYRANTLWMLLERLVRIVCGALSLFLLARHLGPATFGELSYALGVVSIASVLITIAADTVLVRELVGARDGAGDALRVMAVGYAIRLAASLAVIAGLWALAWASDLSATARTYQFVVALSLLPRAFTVVALYFQSVVRSRSTAVANTVQALVSLLLLAAFIAFEVPVERVGWLFVAEGFILAAALVVAFVRDGRLALRWPGLDVALGRRIVRGSLPLMLSSISIILYVRTDQVMLMHLRGATETGVYTLAARFSEMVYFVPAVVSSSFFPALIAASERGRAALDALLRQLLLGLIVLSLATSACVALGAGVGIEWLFGEAYAGSAAILVVLTWSFVFVSIGSVMTKGSIVLGDEYGVLWRAVIGATSNIALNLLLIPRFGAIGAAWASLLSYALSGYFSLLLFARGRALFLLVPKALRADWGELGRLVRTRGR